MLDAVLQPSRSTVTRVCALFLLIGAAQLADEGPPRAIGEPSFLASQVSEKSVSGGSQAGDDAALRSLVEKFFAAYQKQDLPGLMAMWSKGSQQSRFAKEGFERAFESFERIDLKGLEISAITPSGKQAVVRVTVDMAGLERKTGRPAEGVGKMNRTLYCVNQEGTWKVSRYLSDSEVELLAAIAKAPTQEARRPLISANRSLLTVQFEWGVIDEGFNLLNNGEYPQGLHVYAIAQDIGEELGDKAGVAVSLRAAGGIHYFLSNYSEALNHFHRSLRLDEELGNKIGVARASSNIGATEQELGDYGRALEFHSRSLGIAEELGDKLQTLISLNSVGRVYQSLGDYAKAMDHYEKSLRMARELNEKSEIAVALHNIGLVHENQGNYLQAIEHYDKSRVLAEEVGDRELVAVTLDNGGNAERSIGNYAAALGHLERGIKLAEQLGNKSEILSLRESIGLLLQEQGNIARAMEYYQDSVKLAQDLGHKDRTAQVLSRIAAIYQLQGDHTRALETASRAAAIAREIGNPTWLSAALTTGGKAHQALNRLDLARQSFSEAIASVEEMRGRVAGGEEQQQQFFEDKIAPYSAMVALLSDQENPAEAFAYAERIKGRALLDVLRRGRLNINKAMTVEEQGRERKLDSDLVSISIQIQGEKLQPKPDEGRLSDLKARLSKARLAYEAFQTSVYAVHPELKVHRSETQTITLAESSGLIPDGKTALLEFVVTEDRTFLFVLTRVGTSGAVAESTTGAQQSSLAPALKVYPLNIKRKDLADLTRRFHASLSNRRSTFKQLSLRLYETLLQPARGRLKGVTNLVIVPDGILWELPFQALQPAPDRYLIQDCSISYAPSLSVLREMMKKRHERSVPNSRSLELVAFGNPAVGGATKTRVSSIFMDERLDPLPQAEIQVKKLAGFYGPRHSRVYTGAEATESRVKTEAGKCRMLHLATHGILNDASPLYSQLVLSQATQGETEDGLLEAWEIMKLDLNAELVVLSACDTARGRVGAGEGVIGLSWAVFVAGCPATVVSQWKVASASTTELMIEFHRRLVARDRKAAAPISKAEALRQASLKLLRGARYKHPFYWAPFVLVGAGD